MDGQFLIGEKALAGATIVGVQGDQDETSEEVLEDLSELESLLKTLGIPTKDKVIQKRSRFSPRSLLGSGKIDEIRHLVAKNGSELVVVDHALSGLQTRHLEDEIGKQVLDRSGVILDIFARHAKTNQAKTQVEIAQLEYLLPRLAGAWTHFQRQRGGAGGVTSRGMGEKQIEVDRRRARERIARLQKRLEHIKTERETQRKQRRNELKVAIVGYTNSGKTTIMAGLTKASVEGKDELFATLDASTRSLDPNTRPKILLSDTVGFIRHLPHSLVDSFRSTLEEVLSADLLLHIVDISSQRYQQQIDTTVSVLAEIGAADIPSILVLNKTDCLEEGFLSKLVQKKYPNSIALSAQNPEDIVRLRKHVFNYFEIGFIKAHLKVPSDESSALALVYSSCLILDASYETDGFALFEIRAPQSVLNKLDKYQTKER